MKMDDFENRLSRYKEKAEAAVVKKREDYPALHDMEEELCAIINEGNSIRKYLLENKEMLDTNSYMYLTNQIQNPNLLDQKYSCLQLIIYLSKKLFDAYVEYSKTLVEKEDWTELINIYEAIYNLTGSYQYKKLTADVYLKHLDDTDKAFEIYNQIEPVFANNSDFYKNLALIYSKRGDNTKEAECLKKSQEYELLETAKDFSQKREFTKAIETYNKLYEETGNGQYRIEAANIYAVIYRDIDTALKIYKQQEANLSEDMNYWYKRSELYETQRDFYKQVWCMQKAIKLELGKDAA